MAFLKKNLALEGARKANSELLISDTYVRTPLLKLVALFNRIWALQSEEVDEYTIKTYSLPKWELEALTYNTW